MSRRLLPFVAFMFAALAIFGRKATAMQALAYARPAQSSGSAPSILDRAIDVKLDRVSLEAALRNVRELSGVSLNYDPGDIERASTLITLNQRTTVGHALSNILNGTGFTYRLLYSGTVLIEKDAGRSGDTPQAPPEGGGALVGAVRDAQTGAPLPGAVVSLEGGNKATLVGTTGIYRISNIRPGSYIVVAKRLGYIPLRKPVEILQGQIDSVGFSLVPSAEKLDQVVTTINGSQSLVEMANTIGVIPVDSVVATSPITTLGDVLTARVAGVQVFQDGGLTGESPEVNIRGQGSYNGSATTNQPLLYIDGVRVDNTSASGGGTSGRFNDIDPETIESIDIVKGPSAAALYGTDAANGVILIKTKLGIPGATRWNFYTQQGVLDMSEKDRIVSNYYGWGHTTDGTNTPTQCTLALQATDGCVLDSLTHFTPLLDPQTTPFGTGSRQEYGANVSGGSGQWRYYFGGAYNTETGYLKMPDADLAILKAERGALGVSSDEEHPNGLSDATARENLVANVNTATTVSISAGYDSRTARIPNSDDLVFATIGPGYRDSNDGWFLGARPLYDFAGINQEQTSHFTGGVNADWRPTTWFSAHATGGVDRSDSYLDQVQREGEGGPLLPPGGQIGNTKTNTTLYTYSGYAVASLPLPARLASTTTFGANYNRTLVQASLVSGSNLAPGCTTIACAGINNGSEANSDTKVAGLFGVEEVSFANRLFVNGGVRVDAGSTFGNSVDAVVYPKAGVSWVLSREPLFPQTRFIQMLRLRAAYGESGTQPPPSAKLAVETASPASIHDSITVGTGLPTYGNPNLKPERQREFEGGLDADLLQNRVHLEGTLYARRTSDALVQIPAAASLGGLVSDINAGVVSNRGFEVLGSVRPIVTPALTWELTFNASVNHNKLLSFGPGIESDTSVFAPELRPGFPLYSWFGYPVTSYKVSPNGAVLPSNIQVGTQQQFVGPSSPSDQYTFSTTISVWRNLVQLRAQVDRRAGFNEQDNAIMSPCSVSSCLEAYDPNTPLSDRVRYGALGAGTSIGYIENASFTRLREVAVTFNVPSSMMRGVARSLAITLSGRNLALWTNFRASDPESAGAAGTGGIYGAYIDYGYLAPAQYWLLRVNLGL